MLKKFTRLSMGLSLLGLAAVSQAAFAQAAQPSVGAEVIGPSGGVVGTIKAVEGANFVVATDKHEVRIPSSSFTAHEGKFLFGLTRDQLNAEFEKALANASANLAVGMTVYGSQGTAVGTIEALDDQFVTVKLSSGQLAKIARNGFAERQGGAIIGMTAAELEAAVPSGS